MELLENNVFLHTSSAPSLVLIMFLMLLSCLNVFQPKFYLAEKVTWVVLCEICHSGVIERKIPTAIC